jgi:hypothetical protein
MIDPIALGLVKDFLSSNKSEPPREVKLSIPRNHPKIESLIRLAKALATREVLPSGIVVEKLARPGACEEFIAALSELGIDVDALKESLKSTPLSPENKLMDIAGRLLPILGSGNQISSDK